MSHSYNKHPEGRLSSGLRFVWILVLAIALVAPGCITIPELLYIEKDGPGQDRTVLANADCQNLYPLSVLAQADSLKPALDPDGFEVLNWNIYKQKKDGWQQDLRGFALNSDIIVLQESYMVEELRSLLDNNRLFWVVAAAFTYEDVIGGVLTASRVEPEYSCSFRSTEPVIRVPKTAMISLFPFEGTSENLLVANVHMINFTLGMTAYRNQLEILKAMIEGHSGPVIAAGDFNTWNSERVKVVANLFKELGFEEIRFFGKSRPIRFGHALDRVYFRGLEMIDGVAYDLTSSDHNPMQIGFRLPVN